MTVTNEQTLQRAYRWTPATMRAFLEELACSGSVTRACSIVGKSPRSAYDLRLRRDGAALALGWDAAILVARAVVADRLMDRALEGYDEVSVRDEEGNITRRKVDNRLGLNLLSRLDKMAEAQAALNNRNAHVQMVAQDFEAFLELVANGGTGSQAALFCTMRGHDSAHIAPDEKHAIECELRQISAQERAQAEAKARAEKQAAALPKDLIDMKPEEAAANMGIWWDHDTVTWKTNFPPPGLGASDGGEIWYYELEEDGIFGEEDYQRLLTPAETQAHERAFMRERKPWIDACQNARLAWLNMPIESEAKAV